MDKITENTIKVILSAIGIIAEGVVLNNIVGMNGYCTTPFGGTFPCDVIWLILFSIVLLVSAILVLLIRVALKRVKKIIENLVEKVYHWIKTPKLTHDFDLRNPNDLRLFIHNPKQSKEAHIQCYFKGYKTIDGTNYLWEHHNDLHLVEDALGGNDVPFFDVYLKPDETRGSMVGIPYKPRGENKERIALYVTANAHVYGFLDGSFEYVIKCTGDYLGKRFSVPDFKIWLTIENGVLVKIDKAKPTKKEKSG